jgi:hypothetical protein
MSASKRPSTSSLRRFITSRPFVTVAELRRRFGLDDPDAMTLLRRNRTSAWIGLPEREASKLQELWDRGELGVELSVEVRAPVVVGVYPIRIARYVMDATNGNGAYSGGNGQALASGTQVGPPAQGGNGSHPPTDSQREHPRAPRQMFGAPSYAPSPQRLPAPPDTGSG